MIDFLKAKNEKEIVEKIEGETWVFEAGEVSFNDIAKESEEATMELAATKEALRIAEQASKAMIYTKLNQLSKDVENNVVGSEQKYVEL